jgi:hypothetical protein
MVQYRLFQHRLFLDTNVVWHMHTYGTGDIALDQSALNKKGAKMMADMSAPNYLWNGRAISSYHICNSRTDP